MTDRMKWTSYSNTFDTHDGGPVDIFNDTHAPVPGTLIRSLIWVHFHGYTEYDIGSTGIPAGPVGYGFSDLNSQSNFAPWDPADDGMVIESDLLAYDQVSPTYAALGWPPNVASTLTGSINEIDSDGHINETWNLNTFMFGTARSFVDSHGQRLFSEEPQFGFAVQTPVPTHFVNPRWSVLLTVRLLWLPR